MKEKLSTTGMGTHSPHSFWNGKLVTKFNVEVFFLDCLAFVFRFRFFSINKRICRVSFSSFAFVWH